MSIWPRHSKSGKPGSQTFKSSIPAQRPKLYVLAIQSVIPTTSQPTEWSLELSVPQIQHSNSTSAPTSRTPPPRPRHKHGSFLPPSHKHKDHPPIPTSPAADDTTQQETPLSTNHYYLSRLHPDSSSVQRPQNIVLKIFLCSIRASSATTSTDSTPLTTHIADALSPVPSTPDSTSWIRQALFALQISGLIPSVSQGFEVNKFMAFATSYLDQHQHQHVEASRGNENTPEVVHKANYSKIVRENERLRGMLGSDTTDYAVVNAAVRGWSCGPETSGDEDDEDEDCWMWGSSQAINVRGNAQSNTREKRWGGFWVTYGSGAAPRARDVERQARRRGRGREPWERRDPYGGLM